MAVCNWFHVNAINEVTAMPLSGSKSGPKGPRQGRCYTSPAMFTSSHQTVTRTDRSADQGAWPWRRCSSRAWAASPRAAPAGRCCQQLPCVPP